MAEVGLKRKSVFVWSDPFATQPESDFRGQLATDAVGGSLRTLGAALVGLPLNIASNVVVANLLGAEEYGRYAVVLATLTLANTFSNWGISGATAQWLAEARATANPGSAVAVLRKCAGYHLFVQVPIMVAVIIGLSLATDSAAALWLLVPASLSSVLGTSLIVLVSTGMNRQAASVSFAMNILGQTGLILGAVVSRDGVWTYVGGSALSFVGPSAALLWLAPYIRRAILRPVIPTDFPSGFRVYALASGLTATVGLLVSTRSEVFGLQLAGYTAAVGVFALATGIAGQVTVPCESLAAPLLAIIANLYHRDRAKALDDVSNATHLTSMLAGLTAAGLVPGVSVLIPVVYGRDFSDVAAPFVVLASIACLTAAARPLGALAFAARVPGALLRVNLIALTVDILVVVALVPPMGLGGAVAANALAGVTLIVGQVYVVKRRAFLPAAHLKSSLPVAVGVVCGGLASWIGLAMALGPAPLRALSCSAAGLVMFSIASRLMNGVAVPIRVLVLVTERLPAALAAPLSRVMRALALSR